MNDGAAVGASKDAEGTRDSPSKNGLSELRNLLVGREQAQLQQLQQRLDDPKSRSEDVSQVLPEAATLRTSQDKELTRALMPTVEEAITLSVRRDPRNLVDAIFPVLGPAIRKAISAALGAMLQSLNEALEHSLSPRGLKWRIEALRTGKSFAEVVLLHTLRFRVEQVFLIHRETGLLLQHVVAPFVPIQDGSMVSGMFTAIRDFVQDSFGVRKGDTLETLQIGELTVWIEQGPLAILAAVIRGNAPLQLRTTLQQALENIHRGQHEALQAFDGDAGAFELVRGQLEDCLQIQYEHKPAKSAPYAWIVLGIVVAALAVWLVLAVRDNRRWTGYVDNLSAQPGIVVARSGKQRGKYFISGFRDPLALDPQKIMEDAKLDPQKVTSHWEFYQSGDPRFVLSRAQKILDPPETVGLRVEGGVLYVSGSAPQEWIVQSRKLIWAIPGIFRLQADDLTATELRELQSIKNQVESQIIRFVPGTTTFAPGQADTLKTIVAAVRRLFRVSQPAGRGLRLELVGHTDRSGTEELNATLSQVRAETVKSLLVSAGIRKSDLTTRGAGVKEPLRQESTEEDRAFNRAVSFKVVPVNAADRKTGNP